MTTPLPSDESPGDSGETAPARHGASPRFGAFVDKAVQAEFESGRREETEAEARAHILVRIARIVGGTILVIVGIAGLLLPVLPGWALLIPGLGLLSFDVPFAARLLDKVKHRMPHDEDGNLPKSMIYLSVAGFAVFSAISIWWTVLRPR